LAGAGEYTIFVAGCRIYQIHGQGSILELNQENQIDSGLSRVRSFCREEVPPPWGLKGQPGFVLPEGPLDIEIGCGTGLHPLRYSAENPDRFVIALEQTREKFLKFVSRLKNHPPRTNLFPVHGDAIRWISHHIPRQSVSR